MKKFSKKKIILMMIKMIKIRMKIKNKKTFNNK